MDLHLVTYFVAVVDHGGITRAAQSLYISQPSLSQAIRTLERRLGVTLFDRTGRRLELTEAGRRLDVAARRILADVARAKASVASVRTLAAGRVDVVTYSAFSIDPLIGIVRRFREHFPGIIVRLISAEGPGSAAATIRRGEAEIGVVDLDSDHGPLSVHPLGVQELVLALPEHLSTDLPDPVPRVAVRDLPLVLDLGDRGNTVLFAELFGEGAPNVVVDCAHPTATWEFVVRGVGATVLPRSVAENHVPGSVVRSFDPPVTRSVGLLTRPGRPSPAAEAFLSVAGAGLPGLDHSGLDHSGRDLSRADEPVPDEQGGH
ncbi:LysR family transcriptional regulator [Rhodococcus triatomae]|uniref:DNA-binding transcriptional regulator, LysR family n=1 Tax=Rhodococcus triatomae TaxID=300028 RepID=A0A1G8GE03_9NOCA|nr:LysR family transcriptional regulator [Rhodococcus triatomae]QNG20408.1 LysR family transcriptional regulator [Rhodococcus triatomae]QNG23676.1 LysR family transcriptional regulator [Rhodococcus triatomae]SDH92595.1 DNA-binding transcriptional regulator, LysR family [Rhodococcus triatomae]